MKPIDQPRIAFTGWNPFQFLHFEKLSSKFPDATLVVEERKNAQGVFDLESLRSGGKKVVHYDRRRMGKLDGEFDIIVCQTPFAGMEEIRKSRIAMLQYGYAKEAHNFGPWRSIADVCLTFGDYASRKMETFCPAVATGNPRYEDWSSPDFREAARKKYADRIDPAKKTILYAPTWGGLSSLNQFADAVQALSGDFNVILKLHHNSQLAGPAFMDSIRKKFGAICDTRDDIVELLGVADAMISDYSGAIFDAVYCKVPVILLNPSGGESAASSKSDPHSIERSRRQEIGAVVESPSKLQNTVERCLGNTAKQLAAAAGLRAELFTDAANASGLAAETLEKLAEGAFSHNQMQSYIRKEIRASMRTKAELSAARTFGGFVRMVGDQIRKKLHLKAPSPPVKEKPADGTKKRKGGKKKKKAAGTAPKEGKKTDVESPHVVKTAFDAELVDFLTPGVGDNSADIRFIHVSHGPDAPPDTNLVMMARKNPQARACLVHLSKSGYYAYCTMGNCTRFVRSDLVHSLWEKVKSGEFHMSPDEVVYTVTPPLGGGKAARLLVVMSTIYASPHSVSLHRYFAHNFPKIQKYIPPDTAVLRIGDMGGVLGAFYLNTVHRPDNASAIQRVIESVRGDIGVGREAVVLYGASKGGTGAFYHGVLGGYRCIAVDPIVADEHYIKKLNDFHFTLGGVFPEDKEQAFTRLVATRRSPSTPSRFAKHAVIFSERSPQFPHISRILVEPLKDEVAFYNSRNPEIKDHPDVAPNTLNTTTMLLNMQLYGLDITPGVTDID